MRMAGNRLVLGSLAAALAGGLLTSAFVRPEAALTASHDCYGSCRTMTELSLSSIFVIYGREELEHFEVRMRADNPGNGVPTGEVMVESRKKVLCTIHLHFGRGRCSLAGHALAPGLHEIRAHYSGGNGFRSSTSMERTLIVLRHGFFGFGGGGGGLGNLGTL